MKVLIRPEADRDLDSVYEWIAKDNPKAALDTIRRIRAKLDVLATTGFAEIGRRGRERGQRTDCCAIHHCLRGPQECGRTCGYRYFSRRDEPLSTVAST
jgi:plasmid stabilization system protein ParE